MGRDAGEARQARGTSGDALVTYQPSNRPKQHAVRVEIYGREGLGMALIVLDTGISAGVLAALALQQDRDRREQEAKRHGAIVVDGEVVAPIVDWSYRETLDTLAATPSGWRDLAKEFRVWRSTSKKRGKR